MKKWQKPQLTILIRSISDEKVLTTCKGGGIGGSTGSTNNQCYQDGLCLVLCIFISTS